MEAGDLSVCIECAVVLIYTNSAGDLRLASDSDLSKYDEETLTVLKQTQDTVASLNKQNGAE